MLISAVMLSCGEERLTPSMAALVMRPAFSMALREGDPVEAPGLSSGMLKSR